MELRKTVRLAMLLALAIVLNLMESIIPLLGGIIPGIKLGLANIIIIIIIYIYDFKAAFFVALMRVFLVGMIKTGLFNIIFFFSLSGALFSVIFMTWGRRFLKLSIIGVSILGAVMHSVGQIIVAMLYLRTFNLIYYLPYLLILAIGTGLVIGLIARNILSLDLFTYKQGKI